MLIASFIGIVILAIFIGYGGLSGIFSSPSSSQGVPSPTESTTTSKTTTSTTWSSNYIEGVFYNTTAEAGKVIVPLNYLKEHKLVFIDIKTKEKMEIPITYKGELTSINEYSDGQHIPIMLIMSPSGKVHGLLRMDKIDISFNFHIERVLDNFRIVCSSGISWNIETLEYVTGATCACQAIPLSGVALPTTVSEDSVSIDVGVLKVPLA